MIAGAMLAAIAVSAAILGVRPRSAVGRRLARFAPHARLPMRVRAALVTPQLEQSGLDLSAADLVRVKAIGTLAGGAIGALVVIFAPLGIAAVVLLAYAGFVLPTFFVERAAARERAASERGLVTFVEWAEVLGASGRPIESAVVAIAARGVGARLVDGALERAARSYALGAPLFASLAHEAASAGLPALAELASELDRSRELGRAALVALRDHRARLRASERARSLAAAGRVEGQLMLVLVLCYMPALMLLVVIPLFLGLLNGLFV